MQSDITIDSELVSTPHDRERRGQRNIDKPDLLRARRYGMVEDSRFGRKKYTYGGMVFIFDPRKNQAVTSWKIGNSNRSSGTRRVDPVLLRKSVEHDNREAVKQHNRVKNAIVLQKDKWKSHAVLVVDMSGSMRADDVNGARCRSDGVWTAIARDFIMSQLEGEAPSVYDCVSVIVMRETAEIVFCYEPLSWVLYNKFVELREWTSIKPTGPGNYIPALKRAEKLLSFNSHGSCSLALLFFSDGRPSDHHAEKEQIVPKMAEIASRIGRRLTVSCIGMAEQREDFTILKDMAREAEAFGCVASFNKPSLSANSLSHIITSLTSSMTSTKSELTDLRTGRSRTVRNDIVRERKNAPDDTSLNEDWRVFSASSQDMYPVAVHVWHDKFDEFATVMDPRCVSCYGAVADELYQVQQGAGVLCSQCRACYFCASCVQKGRGATRHNCAKLAAERRRGLIVKKCLPSFGVAYKKSAFGEGAERLAFKFRFIDERGNFIGPKMVAKESRFVEAVDRAMSESEYLISRQHSYHRQFVRTQVIAARFGSIYNRTLDNLPKFFGSKTFAKRLLNYPRIRFLEPVIFQLEEKVPGIATPKEYNILVEPMLEGNYRKFNNNFGKIVRQASFVQSEAATAHVGGIDIDDPVISFLTSRSGQPNRKGVGTYAKRETVVGDDAGLGVIAEDSEEDSDSECSTALDEVSHKNEQSFDDFLVERADLVRPERSYGTIPDEDFAQAFSHFTYVRSGGQLMVVDLQGTLNIKQDGKREFVFTDPAIHKRRSRKRGTGFVRRLNFGRTDRGREGMEAFWETHQCNDACRLLGLRPRGSPKSSATRRGNHG